MLVFGRCAPTLAAPGRPPAARNTGGSSTRTGAFAVVRDGTGDSSGSGAGVGLVALEALAADAAREARARGAGLSSDSESKSSETGEGWADTLLGVLGYNRSPSKLQSIIRMAYRQFTCQIEIDGTTVLPLPLFRVLDASDPADYDNRVEPSVQGGAKMGRAFADCVLSGELPGHLRADGQLEDGWEDSEVPVTKKKSKRKNEK